MTVIYPDRLFHRRLSDKLLIAFDQACAVGELAVAHELLCSLEGLFSRPSRYADQDRRKNLESLVEAHERLWTLRHKAAGGRMVGAPAAGFEEHMP